MLQLEGELIPQFPRVVGNKDYDDRVALLTRIDKLLIQSGLEKEFLATFPESERNTPKKISRLLVALRSTVLRMLLQLPYRKAASDFAMSLPYLKFCGLLKLDVIKAPSSSSLERYEKMVPAEVIQTLVTHLNQMAALPGMQADAPDLFLENPVELGRVYADCTALKACVHHPVDWLLFRDATRTLVLAIQQARKHGILNRMPRKPNAYLRDMNKLCIKMTHARRRKNSKKARKKTLRQMKKMMRTVEGIAQGHLEKLYKQGASKGLSILKIQMLAGKFSAILKQVDAIIHLAHERIIGERRVANKDKILSLYERDMHVIHRGKTAAESEFGNTLFLAEQADGLIVDWHLYQDQAPADCKMVPEHIERMEEEHDIKLKGFTGDRGFDSSANNTILEDSEIENYVCPRNIEKLNERLKDEDFRNNQTRRAQTEARIAIITRNFTGNPARKWGYTNKQRFCAWAILTHNLWVLARLPQRPKKLAQAA